MKELGVQGEEIASTYLTRLGYKILKKNYRCPVGEIDVIAQDKKTIVFVEVKTRTSTKFILPYESVNIRKQKKIREVAQWYLQDQNVLDSEVRFDVVSIVIQKNGPIIEHLREAF
jgi:putative endonuclease